MILTNDGMIGLKIRLYPTDDQKNIFKKYFGGSRFAYNYTISKELEEYNKTGKFIGKFDMESSFREYRKSVKWLQELDSTSLKYRIYDCIRAFKSFFNKRTKFPKYKSKKDIYQHFNVRGDRLKIEENVLYIPSIGWINHGKLYSKNMIGVGNNQSSSKNIHRKYYNARVIFDGIRFWLSMSMIRSDVEYHSVEKYGTISDGEKTIGIDLGCKGSNWIVDSVGTRISLPDYTKENKKLRHLHKKLQRQIKRAKTKNSEFRSNKRNKTIEKINFYCKRKTNRRRAKVDNYVNKLLSQKPKAIVLESINVRHMYAEMKSDLPVFVSNRQNMKVNDSAFFDTQRRIAQKCLVHGIDIIFADPSYPSTKRCSCCGNIMDMGKKRVYKCSICGNIIDRDMNAAINLSLYPDISN